jgi:hypothetical protein
VVAAVHRQPQPTVVDLVAVVFHSTAKAVVHQDKVTQEGRLRVKQVLEVVAQEPQVLVLRAQPVAQAELAIAHPSQDLLHFMQQAAVAVHIVVEA